MTWFLSLLARNPLTSILVAAILMVGGGLVAQTVRLSSARAETAEIRAALSSEAADHLVCSAANAQLEAAIAEQNTAIATLVSQAKQQEQRVGQRATQVLKQPLPPVSAPGAAGLNTWLESFP